MSNDNNIKKFTAADIERYHKGLLSAREMHALEKAALDDPFLADALEGYSLAGINAEADIAELRKRLEEKTEPARVISMNVAKKSSFPWLRVAAMIVFLVGASLVAYQFLFKSPSGNNATPTIAKSDENNQAEKSIAGKPADSSSVVLDQVGRSKADSPELKITTTYNYYTTADTVTSGAYSPKRLADADADGRADKFDFKAENAPTASYKKNSSDSVKNFLQGSAAGVNITPSQAPAAKEVSPGLIKDRDGYVTTPLGNVSDDAAKNKALGKQREANGALDEVVVVGYGTQQKTAFVKTTIFRGSVVDADNNPLPFANIINTTDNVGTYTDAKGNFTLVSPDSTMNVQVKVVGFENKKLNLRGDLPLNQIVMQEDKIAADTVDRTKRNFAKRSRDAAITIEEPEPADGWAYYDSYLQNNLKIPEDGFEKKKTDDADVVELSFEVNKNGEPVNIRVEKSLCQKCDEEAKRLIKEGPKWKRKGKKGKRTTVIVPFTK